MRGTDRHNDSGSSHRRIFSRSNSRSVHDAADYSEENDEDKEEDVDGRDTDSQQEKHNSRKFQRRKGYDRSERERSPRKKSEEDIAGGDPAESDENLKERKALVAHGRRRLSGSVSNYRDRKEERHRGARKSARASSSSEESEDDEERHDNGRSRKRGGWEREKHGRHSERRGSKRKHRVERAERRRGYSTESETASSSSGSEVSDREDEVRRGKKRQHDKRRKRKKREKDRRLDKEAKRKLKKKMESKKDRKAELKKKKHEMRSKQPITTSWGKYGILKDIDMWNKRPEFSAWLAEVKKVNMETLPNWEEKEMFKEYMEDYNTATFPSKKYYNIDVYHRRKATKARMKGMAKLAKVERTDFNDEDERRVELLREREQQKDSEVQALLRKMQSGMAQDMKEQAQLREEMQYQFRLGNTEAAQAIQRRLDPDADKFVK